MSEMVANKGIIKELYPGEKNLRNKLQLLASNLGIKLSELVNEKGIEDGEAWFNSKYWSDYTLIGGRLFDTTNCPDIYDYEADHDDTMEKVGEHEYKLDFYYYNGGTCMEEIFEDLVEKADKEYKQPITPKEIFGEAVKKAKVSELEAFVLIQQIYEELDENPLS